MNKKFHILFVTSSNLATNPRCVKEVELALEQGFQVSVVKFKLGNWSESLEKQIEQELSSAKFYTISATRSPLLPWLMATVIYRLAIFLSQHFTFSLRWNAYAAEKRTWLIQRFLDKFSSDPNLLVAHNPATFWPVMRYSKKKLIPFVIDVEDYHPGECKDARQRDNVTFLMKGTLPQASWVTFAAPLIAETTVAEIPSIKKYTTIDNCFKVSEFLPPNPIQSEKLQVIWYSQNIAFGRGLEKLIPSLAKYHDNLQLTLVGNLRQDMADFLSDFAFIETHKPMRQTELHAYLNGFDIGLAIEEKTADYNREICLTNKIWSYFQAGLYVAASDTLAQKIFLQQHNSHGITFNLENVQDVCNAFDVMQEKKAEIRQCAEMRFNKARKHSWAIEKLKLKDIWSYHFLHN